MAALVPGTLRMSTLLFSLSILVLVASGCASSSPYVSAKNCLARGEYARAIVEYQRFLLQTIPDERSVLAKRDLSEAYYRLGLEEFNRGSVQPAERLFYSANTADADSMRSECFLSLARSSLERRDFALAAEEASRAAAASGSPSTLGRAASLRIRSFWATNNVDACLEEIRPFRDVLGSLFEPEVRGILDSIAAAHVERGASATANGQYQAAIDTYKRLTALPYFCRPDTDSLLERTYLAWADVCSAESGLPASIALLEEAQDRGFSTPGLRKRLDSLRETHLLLEIDRALASKDLTTQAKVIAALDDARRSGLATPLLAENSLKLKIAHFLQLGDGALGTGNLSTAESHFVSVLALAPDHAEAQRSIQEIQRLRDEAMQNEEREARRKAVRTLRENHPTWSGAVLEAILDRKVFLGMSSAQVLASWGAPDSKMSQTGDILGSSYTFEQWVYGDIISGAQFLYFEDGELTSWQNWEN